MVKYEHSVSGGSHRYYWRLKLGDEAQPAPVAGATYLTAQVIVHRTEAISQDRLVIEGSLEPDPPEYFFLLRDKESDILVFKSSDGAPINSIAAFIRPRIPTEGSDGYTIFNVYLLARS